MKHRNIVNCIAAALLCAAILGSVAAWAAKPAKPSDSAIVAKCKADLAARLKVPAADIKLVESQAVTWRDAALGMPEPDRIYAQALTPGFRVTLEARSSKYLYTTSMKSIRYGGPVALWSYSMLFTRPMPKEPNLNGYLYQCSLLGTNCVRIASGVTDVYPQAKGAVLATARTSRSGFDLVLINAAQPGKIKKLYSSFAFGGAALNDRQDKWAAFVKPVLGSEWGVVVAPVSGGQAKSLSVTLPNEVRPGSIAWSGDRVIILSRINDVAACYEMTPGGAKPAWNRISPNEFPGPEYMLNKSQTLEISQDGSDVEVAKVWFTGDHDVIAKLPGVSMERFDFLGGRWAFVSGRKNDQPVSYAVDIGDGEVIASPAGVGEDIKPFAYPPRSTPLANKP